MSVEFNEALFLIDALSQWDLLKPILNSHGDWDSLFSDERIDELLSSENFDPSYDYPELASVTMPIANNGFEQYEVEDPLQSKVWDAAWIKCAANLLTDDSLDEKEELERKLAQGPSDEMFKVTYDYVSDEHKLSREGDRFDGNVQYLSSLRTFGGEFYEDPSYYSDHEIDWTKSVFLIRRGRAKDWSPLSYPEAIELAGS